MARGTTFVIFTCGEHNGTCEVCAFFSEAGREIDFRSCCFLCFLHDAVDLHRVVLSAIVPRKSLRFVFVNSFKPLRVLR